MKRPIILGVIIISFVLGHSLDRAVRASAQTPWIFTYLTSQLSDSDWHRFFGVTNDTTGRTKASCPSSDEAYVIIGFGQSNSANTAGHRHKAEQYEKIFSYFNGDCFFAADPMLGSGGTGGSLWIPLARRLNAHKRPVVILTMGVGSSKVSDWMEGGKLRKFYNSSIRDFVSKYPNPDLIIWVQGESDVDTEPEKYASQLDTLMTSLELDFPKSQIGISGTSYCFGRGNEEIVRVQKRVAEKRNLIFLGVTDELVDPIFRYDDCHFSEQGIIEVTKMFANALDLKLNSFGDQ